MESVLVTACIMHCVVTGYITQAVISCVIAERETRQLIMQCGGRIWASATIILYLSCNALKCNYCARKLRFARARIQPAPCDLTFVAVQNG